MADLRGSPVRLDCGPEDPGGGEQVGGDAGGVGGESGAEGKGLALGGAGRVGAEADEAIAAGRWRDGGPADDLAPEPMVVGVADAEPPPPGAVGADPEHLAQSVGLRDD